MLDPGDRLDESSLVVERDNSEDFLEDRLDESSLVVERDNSDFLEDMLDGVVRSFLESGDDAVLDPGDRLDESSLVEERNNSDFLEDMLDGVDDEEECDAELVAN